MNKNALVVSGLVVLLALSGSGFGMSVVSPAASFVAESAKLTADEARKIALKRVPGTVEDEYTFEDDNGDVETYVFIIKKSDEKIFEVQIGAEKGDVISVEEYTDDDSSEDPPSV